jgi:hypothetical protein
VENTFDLKKFLIENKLTVNSKLLEADSESEQITSSDVQQGLNNGLAILQQAAANAKPVESGKTLDESLLLGAILTAPSLLKVLGNAVNGISYIFQDKDADGTVVGDALVKWGDSWKEKYLEGIGGLLLGLFPEKFKGQDINDKTSLLYRVSIGLYAAMLLGVTFTTGTPLIAATKAAPVTTTASYLGASMSPTIIKLIKKYRSIFTPEEVTTLAKKLTPA